MKLSESSRLKQMPRTKTDRAWRETAWPPVIGKEGRTSNRFRLLIVISIALLVSAAVLLTLGLTLKSDRVVLTAEQVRSMPKTSGSFRSINNWATVETFEFDGVRLTEFLARCGVKGASQTVKVIAPDGYFWPKVGTTLSVEELARENAIGLVPMIAYREKGHDLDAEPDGTGPLRYVAPQYKESDVNKPSWVSNLRLIEVGPLPKGYKKLDAKKVPSDQIWVYGNVSSQGPIALWIPVLVGCAGLVLLVVALIDRRSGRTAADRLAKSADDGAGPGTQTLVVLLVAVLSLGACCMTARPSAAATSVTFTLTELKSMPSFSGHYSFLKQLEPYTYYEEDYKGVALDTILDQVLRVDAGASQIVFKAKDGYAVTLSLDEARATYPNNLKAIVAYEKDSGKALSDDEGPIRLIVPQQKPGKRDQGGDANTPKCERMLATMEVSPVPSGVQAISPGSVTPGSLGVFGSVSPAPAPAPAPTPAPQPASNAETPAQPQAAPQAAATQGAWNHEAVVALFGGSCGFARLLCGAAVSAFLPRASGTGMRRFFFKVGSGR